MPTAQPWPSNWAENVAAQVLAVAREYTHLLFPATRARQERCTRVAALLDVARSAMPAR